MPETVKSRVPSQQPSPFKPSGKKRFIKTTEAANRILDITHKAQIERAKVAGRPLPKAK